MKVHLLAFVAVLAIIGGGQANAAIRTEVTVGSTTRYFYNGSSDTSLVISPFSIDAYSAVLEVTGTNFSGATTGGTLSQSLTLLDVDSAPSDVLTIQSWVINTVAGLSNGEITIGSQITSLMGASEKYWLSPSSGAYSVSSDGAVSGGTVTGLVTETILNSGTANQSIVTDLAADNVKTTGSANAINGGKYFLSQRLTIDGAAGDHGTVSGYSEVTAPPGGPTDPVPEPATLAVWSLGLGIAGLVRLRRKK